MSTVHVDYHPEVLADRIGALRLQKKWTRETLAERSGITYHTLTKLELGKNTNPTLETMIALAKAFDVSLDALLT